MALVSLVTFFPIIICIHSDDVIPCHVNDGPMDKTLKCDSSHHQIISGEGDKKTRQKKNLIIFEIADAILEPKWRFHAPIPFSLRANIGEQLPFYMFVDDETGLELLFVYKPEPMVIVFRKHFFQTLDFIHSNISADLVIYSRQNQEYTQQVSLAIEQRFKEKYGIITEDPLFKMVISTKNAKTAKTISTLAHNLSLNQYDRIIILDDAESCWCKHDLMQLKWQKRMPIKFIPCPPFVAWKNVYVEYRDWYVQNVAVFGRESSSKPLSYFCSLAAKHRQNDNEFVELFGTLQNIFNSSIGSTEYQ